jgi:zinc/manganese transport system substrate-binding protein
MNKTPFRRRFNLLLAHGIATALIFVCSIGQSRATDQSLRIVTSFSILEDLVKNVTADVDADVSAIVPSGGDSHTFEPTPSVALRLTKANVVFAIGAGFEVWLDDLYKASGTKARLVNLSDGVDLIKLEEHEEDDHHDDKHAEAEHHDDDHGDAHEHHHGEFDPHIWNDPVIAIHMVKRIAAVLEELDTAHADKYRSNASAYVTRLEALDKWVRDETALLPEGRRKLVTTHDTFAYFARRYGYTVVGSVLGSASTEAHDPSAAASARLVKAIKAENVPAIFADIGENAEQIQNLAEAAGVKVGPQLHPDALTAPDGPAANYESLVRHNVASIVNALK